jgi:hypothetical protein
MLFGGAMAEALVAVEGLKVATEAVGGKQGHDAQDAPVPHVPNVASKSIDSPTL